MTRIRKIFNRLSLTTVLPVVLIVVGVLLNVLVLRSNNQQSAVLGGPDLLASALETIDGESDSILADNVFNEEFELAESGEGTAGFVIVDGTSFVNASNPLSTVLPSRDGLLIYKVQKGDTLSTIAANFGISVNTIFWANSKLSSSIRPGQEIAILPVSGVLHQIEEGDTLDSVSELYGVPREKIFQYNQQLSKGLRVGSGIVIPGAKPKKSLAGISGANLPNYPGYFIIPTTGWNWGQLHYNNAIDIANACGTPIYAAAEGLVVKEFSYGYNDGYGHYIDLEHPNGAITRYAHTQKNSVSIGDYVSQGDLIAYIGNTGKTHGPTGCHLHFEVKGAKNPFAK